MNPSLRTPANRTALALGITDPKAAAAGKLNLSNLVHALPSLLSSNSASATQQTKSTLQQLLQSSVVDRILVHNAEAVTRCLALSEKSAEYE